MQLRLPQGLKGSAAILGEVSRHLNYHSWPPSWVPFQSQYVQVCWLKQQRTELKVPDWIIFQGNCRELGHEPLSNAGNSKLLLLGFGKSGSSYGGVICEMLGLFLARPAKLKIYIAVPAAEYYILYIAESSVLANRIWCTFNENQILPPPILQSYLK